MLLAFKMYQLLKNSILLLLVFFICGDIFSQEINAKVTVNASKVNSTVDRKIFVTLQNQLNNFLNSRKWTNDKFEPNEKIDCSFLLNIQSVADVNVYKASLIVQAARPVFNASYNAALINFQDADVTFKYIEFQALDFSDTRVQGSDALAANLTASFAYYIYTILGLDYDSFSPKGGDVFYQKALNVVNNAPEGSNISGWRAFDGLRNRYWLNENFVNTRNNIIHDFIYAYYRLALDKMFDNEKEARSNMLQALIQIDAFNKEIPNTMFIDFFMQTRVNELIGVFKNATADEKQRAADLLSRLDVANASKYKQELK